MPRVQRLRRRAGRALVLGSLGIAAAIGSAIAAAPYLPRLVHEGYPALRWPAAGSFADVKGDASAKPFPETGAIDTWSEKLLAGSGGEVLLVHFEGRLQLAHYAEGVAAETRFNSFSMAKSLVGALLLKAVAEGRIHSLDDPIGHYLPDIGDRALRTLPLRAFATMHSGLAAEAGTVKSVSGPSMKDLEAYRLNPFGPMARLHMTGVEAVGSELRSVPALRGTFSYQNVNTAVLGQVLSSVYGAPLEALVAEKIWLPAGAAPAHWRRYGSGLQVTPYCCVYATASDWLRVGVYLMRNGTPGAPFLPRPLWRELFGASVSEAQRSRGHYGLHVYHDVLDRKGQAVQGPFTYMFGNLGQVIYMMPERDLVVVRFGNGIQLLHSTLYAASAQR